MKYEKTEALVPTSYGAILFTYHRVYLFGLVVTLRLSSPYPSRLFVRTGR